MSVRSPVTSVHVAQINTSMRSRPQKWYFEMILNFAFVCCDGFFTSSLMVYFCVWKLVGILKKPM